MESLRNFIVILIIILIFVHFFYIQSDSNIENFRGGGGRSGGGRGGFGRGGEGNTSMWNYDSANIGTFNNGYSSDYDNNEMDTIVDNIDINKNKRYVSYNDNNDINNI